MVVDVLVGSREAQRISPCDLHCGMRRWRLVVLGVAVALRLPDYNIHHSHFGQLVVPMGKQPGRGVLARKKAKTEAKYEAAPTMKGIRAAYFVLETVRMPQM